MAKSKENKKYSFVYVISVKETSVVNAECDKLLDSLIEPSQRPMGLLSVDPAQSSAIDILDELRTLPFLTDKRFVLIRGAEKFVSENRELLEKYFNKPSPTGVLILTVGTWDSRTRLAKKLPDIGELISIQPPKAGQLPFRLAEYAQDAHNKKLSHETARILIELCGDNLGQLYGEIDKLALFAQDQKVITAQHVEALVGNNRFFNALEVIDAMVESDAGRAVQRLRIMFSEDKTAEFTVVGAFAYHFRRMFNAKVMLEKGSSVQDVAAKLNIWNKKESFFSHLSKMSLEHLAAVLKRLAQIDYEIKTGQTKAPIAAEQLVLNIASRQSQATVIY
ncbi:MAG: DNA polymerase III subunit delta [Candidatus Brocadiia bacterium]|nr:MAG: DNA polymerase III subunit delta [Candidatus Brocadiia bacterium]